MQGTQNIQNNPEKEKLRESPVSISKLTISYSTQDRVVPA